MVFSASFTRKLMEISAATKKNTTTGGSVYINIKNDCLCVNCSGIVGQTCCDLKINPPSTDRCKCLYRILDRNIVYDVEDEAKPIQNVSELTNLLKLNEGRIYKRKHRQVISTHHKHIYKNYLLSNKKSLQMYLKEESKRYKNEMILANLETKSYIDDFWNCYVLDTSYNNGKGFMRKLVYQIASQKKDDVIKNEYDHQCLVQDMWRMYRADSTWFYGWIYRLRLWLSATILDRIVNEIESVNKELNRIGYISVSVGSTGIGVLENVAHNPFVTARIPTLPLLITFLELTPYQNYVVQRIKELSKGGCMNEYNWSNGGTYNNKPWAPNLPTDAKLIMHLLCTYLDFFLPLKCYANQKPFTSKYFRQSSDKTTSSYNNNNNNKIYIEEVREHPPHYRLFIDSQMQELPPGRNNLFYAIILFLKYIERNESSVLGNISLGFCGLNMLWIIQNR